ncbi:MAG: sugar phosphate isomerase/epimerase [Phocaeicola sp.]|nr:sugar phosphate isomerase/epimerase [Phocaeicola sp.]
MKLKYLLMMAIAAMMVMPSCKKVEKAEPVKKNINVQLYSLRSLINEESPIDSLLPKLAAMGFTGVEAASYNDGKFYGKTPADYKAVVEANGLNPLSSHINHGLSPEELESGDFSEALKWWDQCIADHKAAGMKYIVTPWMGLQKSIHDLQVYCDYFNAIGKKCAENGIQYGYHNHAYEYEKVEDQVMYDYMLEHTDPQYVFFQMDVYWTMRGGKSQVEYFKKYPGRFKMLHIKDECELGQSGMVGFDAIFKNIKEAGTKEIIVEVERYSMPVIESIKESIDYLLQSDFVPASYE